MLELGRGYPSTAPVQTSDGDERLSIRRIESAMKQSVVEI